MFELSKIEKKRDVSKDEVEKKCKEIRDWVWAYTEPPEGDFVKKTVNGTFLDVFDAALSHNDWNIKNKRSKDSFIFWQEVFKEKGNWLASYGEYIQIPEDWDADLVKAILEVL